MKVKPSLLPADALLRISDLKAGCGIPVYGKRKLAKVALVDPEDFELCIAFKWSLSHGYARSGMDGGGCVSMHRLVLGMDKTDRRVVDHINGDPCDNRKSNLRACTTRQNAWNQKIRADNKTGYKGVKEDTRHPGLFYSRIRVNGKYEYLGSYDDPLKAWEAYRKRATEVFGEFARVA